MYLNAEFRPLADEFSSDARYIASVQTNRGYPWNGIHPETGETCELQEAKWYTFQDIKEL